LYLRVLFLFSSFYTAKGNRLSSAFRKSSWEDPVLSTQHGPLTPRPEVAEAVSHPAECPGVQPPDMRCLAPHMDQNRPEVHGFLCRVLPQGCTTQKAGCLKNSDALLPPLSFLPHPAPCMQQVCAACVLSAWARQAASAQQPPVVRFAVPEPAGGGSSTKSTAALPAPPPTGRAQRLGGLWHQGPGSCPTPAL
jgi:hypothetical protein